MNVCDFPRRYNANARIRENIVIGKIFIVGF